VWIALAALVVVLALVAGGGTFVFAQYRAPRDAAAQFCTDWREQDYAAAYNLLSSTMRANRTQQQFMDEAAALDQAEGKVTSCT
jgi:hypothetical protein